jgi:hypothetical protein
MKAADKNKLKELYSSKRPAAPVPGDSDFIYSMDNPGGLTGCGVGYGYRHAARAVIMKQIEEARAWMRAMRHQPPHGPQEVHESNAAASVSPALFNRGTQVQESVSSTSSEDWMRAMRRLNESNAAASVSPALFNRVTQVQESVSSTSSEDSEAGAHPTV